MTKSAIGYLTFLFNVILKYASYFSKWLIWNRLLTKILHVFFFQSYKTLFNLPLKKSVDTLY